jgi:U3 small nucleolar RNA-associated protein 14
LKSAGLKDEDIHQTEEAMLQMNELSVEEVAQRRGELRKTRELMFRAEVKARHVGKIKNNNTFTTRPLAASDTSSVTLKSTDLLSPPPLSPIPNRQHSPPPTPPIGEPNSNPWLTRISEPTVKLTKKANEVVVQKSSKALDNSKNKMRNMLEKEKKKCLSLRFKQMKTIQIVIVKWEPKRQL